MIKTLCKKSSVHDDNVINLLNYYELVNELKTIHGQFSRYICYKRENF